MSKNDTHMDVKRTTLMEVIWAINAARVASNSMSKIVRSEPYLDCCGRG